MPNDTSLLRLRRKLLRGTTGSRADDRGRENEQPDAGDETEACLHALGEGARLTHDNRSGRVPVDDPRLVVMVVVMMPNVAATTTHVAS